MYQWEAEVPKMQKFLLEDKGNKFMLVGEGAREV
jgi:hypothetical protein